MIREFTAALLVCCGAAGAVEPTPARLAEYADAFARNLPQSETTETLTQRSYGLPPHPRIAIGAAADTLHSEFRVHEIVSEYTAGTLKGDRSGALVELRELVSMDGAPKQTPLKARKALEAGVGSNPDATRKKMLAVFTQLGLEDVATDYGLILLAFTTAGSRDIEFETAGAELVGAEDAVVWNWRQKSGGALEFRGRKTARRLLSGRIWLRASDGAPLRIQATFEHAEPKHLLRDDASVEYRLAKGGWWAPVSVAHRHSVDGAVLTENLYTYEAFRTFTSDTTIRYTGAGPNE